MFGKKRENGDPLDLNLKFFPTTGYLREGGTPRDAGIGGQANAFSKSGGKFNGFSQYVSGRSSKGVAVKDAKEELYREARGNFKSFLAGLEGVGNDRASGMKILSIRFRRETCFLPGLSPPVRSAKRNGKPALD